MIRAVIGASWLGLALLLFSPGSSHAVSQAGAIVDTFSPSARGAALGHAGGVIPEGPFAIRWNPAGMALDQPVSAGATYNELAAGLASDVWILHVGGTAKVGPIGFGAYFARLDQGEQQSVGTGPGASPVTFESSERALRFGAAVDLFDLMEVDTGSSRIALSIGAGAKWLDVNLAPAEVTQDLGIGGGAGEASSWTMDAGVLFRFGQFVGGDPASPDGASYVGLRTSLAYDCLIENDLVFAAADQSDPLPRRLHYGAAFEAELFPRGGVGHLVDLVFAFERLESEVPGDDTRVNSLGLEITAANALILRGGSYEDPEGNIVGGSYGAGLRLSPPGWQFSVQLDYANRPQAAGLERIDMFTATLAYDRFH